MFSLLLSTSSRDTRARVLRTTRADYYDNPGSMYIYKYLYCNTGSQLKYKLHFHKLSLRIHYFAQNENFSPKNLHYFKESRDTFIKHLVVQFVYKEMNRFEICIRNWSNGPMTSIFVFFLYKNSL